jgi:uncharacterized protein YciI
MFHDYIRRARHVPSVYVREETRYKTQPSDDLRKAHLNFLTERGDQGKVLLAGRFSDKLGALIVWRVESVEEAQRFASEDPYVRASLVEYTLREWVTALDYTKNPPLRPT